MKITDVKTFLVGVIRHSWLFVKIAVSYSALSSSESCHHPYYFAIAKSESIPILSG